MPFKRPVDIGRKDRNRSCCHHNDEIWLRWIFVSAYGRPLEGGDASNEHLERISERRGNSNLATHLRHYYSRSITTLAAD